MTQEPDEQRADDGVADHRARVRNLLPEITEQAKQALADANIDLDVLLIVPRTGDAIATVCTPDDPADEVWSRTSEIVSGIMAQALNLDCLRSRHVTCGATTDHPSPSEISPANWPAMPMPIPAPLADR
jgi:hypothetical protein